MPDTRTTRVTRRIAAPRAAVYRALLDPAAVQAWRVPDGMRSQVHAWEPRPGGAVRVSLTYDAPDGDAPSGKTTPHTDTYAGRFTELVPDERVVELLAFETDDPDMAGEMRVAYALRDTDDGGTDRTGTHEGLPPGVSPEDNETGWRMSLAKLAALVEGP